jgi:excisionase family DNA binding protein
MTRFLTANELAAHLKVKPETIRRWARIGRIPYKKFSAKVMRFNAVAVQQALNKLEQRQGSNE